MPLVSITCRPLRSRFRPALPRHRAATPTLRRAPPARVKPLLKSLISVPSMPPGPVTPPPGSSTATGGKSCRTRRPGAPLRSHEKGDGVGHHCGAWHPPAKQSRPGAWPEFSATGLAAGAGPPAGAQGVWHRAWDAIERSPENKQASVSRHGMPRRRESRRSAGSRELVREVAERLLEEAGRSRGHRTNRSRVARKTPAPVPTGATDTGTRHGHAGRRCAIPNPRQRRPPLDHQALQAVVAQACVHGASTRSVDDLVEAFGSETRTSKSEVLRICLGTRRTARCSAVGYSITSNLPTPHSMPFPNTAAMRPLATTEPLSYAAPSGNAQMRRPVRTGSRSR